MYLASRIPSLKVFSRVQHQLYYPSANLTLFQKGTTGTIGPQVQKLNNQTTILTSHTQNHGTESHIKPLDLKAETNASRTNQPPHQRQAGSEPPKRGQMHVSNAKPKDQHNITRETPECAVSLLGNCFVMRPRDDDVLKGRGDGDPVGWVGFVTDLKGELKMGSSRW